MKNKINIAELLKDCPKGMELYSPIYGVGVLFKVTGRIHVKFPKEHNVKCFRLDGKVSEDGEIMLFPKGKTTWEGFVPPCKFKDGDVVVTTLGNIAIIRKPMGVKSFYVYGFMSNNDFYKDEAVVVKVERLATEEEKEKLFQAIKDNGYKWNTETKTLEKLIVPKFKVGDRVKSKISQYEYTIVDIGKDAYTMSYATDKFGYPYPVPFYNEDNFELVFNKFDINTLKPFDKVLIRLTNNCVWMPKFFSHYDTGPNVKYYPFVTTDNIGYPQCIPYNDDTKHLLGKTDNCDEFYKTWK